MSALDESNQPISRFSCCPSCGSTQVDSHECLQCGIVLEHFRSTDSNESQEVPNFDSLTDDQVTKRRFRAIPKLRWLSLAAAATLAFLVSLPATAPPVQHDPAALERLAGKMTKLDTKLEAGRSHTMRIDESEANTWLLHKLSNTLSQSEDVNVQEVSGKDEVAKGWAGTIPDYVNDLRVRLNRGSLLFHLNYQVFGKEFSVQVEGVPEINQGYLSVRPLSARLGVLPLPGGVVAPTVSRIFEPASRMADFLLPPQLKEIQVADGELVLEFNDFLSSLL